MGIGVCGLQDCERGGTMTSEYVRKILENRQTILNNLVKAARQKISLETENDIIEGLTLSAQDYGRDRIQGGSSDKDIGASVKKEKRKGFFDVHNYYWIIDSRKAEIEAIDYEVFMLPPVTQSVILMRYYDKLGVTATAMRLHKEKLFYSESSVKRITCVGIDRIAARMTAKGFEELEDMEVEK